MPSSSDASAQAPSSSAPAPSAPSVLDGLRRWPDVEGPDLLAADAADRLILDEAAPLLAGHGPVAVVGDRYGALTVGALLLHGVEQVTVHTDRLSGEQALMANAETLGVADRVSVHALDAALLEGAEVVLAVLPRSLAGLDELAGAVARHAAPGVVLLAGGRLKHMTPSMNEVLSRHFAGVRASLGRQKSRVLVAQGPLPGDDGYPLTAYDQQVGLTVMAHGEAFAGAKVDHGTRFLLDHLDRMKPDAAVVVDLGCGTGVLACAVKRARPHAQVVAVDSSAAAVASARATASANRLDVDVRRSVGIAGQADASVDLVLLNPPFHSGAAVVEQVSRPLFAEAARVLRPGGELWCVYNSHLQHKTTLRRMVGETEQVGRNRSFTVTRSVKA